MGGKRSENRAPIFYPPSFTSQVIQERRIAPLWSGDDSSPIPPQSRRLVRAPEGFVSPCHPVTRSPFQNLSVSAFQLLRTCFQPKFRDDEPRNTLNTRKHEGDRLKDASGISSFRVFGVLMRFASLRAACGSLSRFARLSGRPSPFLGSSCHPVTLSAFNLNSEMMNHGIL